MYKIKNNKIIYNHTNETDLDLALSDSDIVNDLNNLKLKLESLERLNLIKSEKLSQAEMLIEILVGKDKLLCNQDAINFAKIYYNKYMGDL